MLAVLTAADWLVGVVSNGVASAVAVCGFCDDAFMNAVVGYYSLVSETVHVALPQTRRIVCANLPK